MISLSFGESLCVRKLDTRSSTHDGFLSVVKFVWFMCESYQDIMYQSIAAVQKEMYPQFNSGHFNMFKALIKNRLNQLAISACCSM